MHNMRAIPMLNDCLICEIADTGRSDLDLNIPHVFCPRHETVMQMRTEGYSRSAWIVRAVAMEKRLNGHAIPAMIERAKVNIKVVEDMKRAMMQSRSFDHLAYSNIEPLESDLNEAFEFLLGALGRYKAQVELSQLRRKNDD